MGKSVIRFFSNITKMVRNFGIPSSNFYTGLEAYRGGVKVFDRGLFDSPYNIYY